MFKMTCVDCNMKFNTQCDDRKKCHNCRYGKPIRNRQLDYKMKIIENDLRERGVIL